MPGPYVTAYNRIAVRKMYSPLQQRTDDIFNSTNPYESTKLTTPTFLLITLNGETHGSTGIPSF
jgi:hypothetical protein